MRRADPYQPAPGLGQRLQGRTQQADFADAAVRHQQFGHRTDRPAAAGQLCRQRVVAGRPYRQRRGTAELAGPPQVGMAPFQFGQGALAIQRRFREGKEVT
ncbi:hypothetical protein [Cupriavidus sp. H18C1]|uniref:hypothetical protein n=1 Tax=Cupriavidus sp. H18C1 TaxID=3241601 RepID=UPI003BB9528B